MTTYEITFNERSKVGKNLLAFLEDNKKYVKFNDPTKMTKKEFYARIKEAEEQYERGEYHKMLPGEDLFDYLKRREKEENEKVFY